MTRNTLPDQKAGEAASAVEDAPRKSAEVRRDLISLFAIFCTCAAVGPVWIVRVAASSARMMPEGEFVEIFIDTPIEEAERRDVKGLYKKARAGQLKNFTGIDSPYEAPQSPEITIKTTEESPEDAAERIVAQILGAVA